MKRHLNREKGITIVSLIVTIIVLLILTSIALVSFNGDDIKDKTTNSKIYTELSQLSEKIEKIKISEEGERISNSIYTNTVNNEDLKSSGIGIVKTLTVTNPEMEIGVIDLEKLNIESTIGNNYKNINDSGTIAKLTDLSDVFFIEMETGKVYYIDKKIYSLQGNVLPEDVKGNSQQSDGPSITIGNVSVDNAHNKIQFSISASENNNVNLSSNNKYEYYISTSPTKLQGGEWKEYTSGNTIEETRRGNNTYYIFVKPIKDEQGNESEGNTIVNGVKYHKSEGCVITNQITLAINPNGGKYNNSTETSYLFGNKGETTIDEIQDAEGLKYTIEYNGNGGTTPEPQEVAKIFTNWTLKGKGTLRNKRFTFGDADAILTARYNETAQEIRLQTSERNGYTFKGWYTEAEEGTKVGDAGDSYTPTRDLSLYAQWDVNKYYVTLNPGATGTLPGKNKGEIQTIEVTYDSTYGALPEPTKVGCEFKGWFTQAIGGEQITADTKVNLTDDQTLYAQWEGAKYELTLDPGTEGTLPNKNKGETDTQQVEFGSLYGTLPTPTRTGYEFEGWFTQAEGGTPVTAETEVTTAGNHILHAHWNARTYTVTINPGSEGTLPGKNKGETDSINATYDSTYGTIPTPTREGYSFEGWFTAQDGGDPITSSTPVTITGEQTIYAHWTANSYTVKYNNNNGTGSMADQSFTYGVTQGLTTNAFTRDGYTFSGWNTAADGTGTPYTNEQQVSNLTTENNGIVTLYAQWTGNPYNITYDYNGGVDASRVMGKWDARSPQNTATTLADLSGKNKNGTLYAGAKFKNDHIQFDGAQAGVRFQVMNSPYMTLEATFSVDKIVNKKQEIISNIQTGGMDIFLGETGVILGESYVGGYKGVNSGITVEVGKKYHVILTYDGVKEKIYVNGAMAKERDLSGAVTYSSNTTVMALGFNPNGATGTNAEYFNGKIYSAAVYSNTNETKQVIQGTQVGELPIPTREGYTFNGWYIGDTKIESTSTFTNAADARLEARWTPNTYTIKYNADTGSTGTMGDTVVTFDNEINLPAKQFTKDDYTYFEWNTSQDKTGIRYNNEENVLNLTSENNGIVNLYTVYGWNITYNLNNGTLSSANPNYYNEEKLPITLNNPAKTGHSFTGWTGSNGDTPNTSLTIAQGARGDFNYTANFEPYKLYIQYSANGGTMAPRHGASFSINEDGLITNNGSTIIQTVNYGSQIGTNGLYDYNNSDAINIIKPGYTMDLHNAWSRNPDGTGTSYSQVANYQATNIAPELANGDVTVTLYAKWTPITYTVNFDKNAEDATGEVAAQTFTYDVAQNLNDNNFARTHFSFAGWNTAADGTGTNYADKESVSNLTTENNGTVTLYAKWEGEKHNAILNPGTEGTLPGKNKGETDTKEVEYGSTFGTLPEPTRTGYNFAGWFTATDGGDQVTAETTVAITENQTLHAHWTANTYTVTINPGTEGTLPNKNKGETDTINATYDATYGTLPVPTRTGYTFAGWFTEETGGTQITESTTVTITGVQTLYAHWNGEEYEITLNNQSATSAGTPSIYETYEEKYSLTSGGQAMTTSSNAITKPQRTGFTFGGYYTERNGEGTQVIDGNGFVTQGATAKEFSSNGTLYAKWTDTTNPSLVLAKETTQDGFEDWELSGRAFIDTNGYLNLPDSTSEAKSRYYNAEEPWYLTYDSYTSTGIQGNNTQGGSYFVSKYYNSGLANINNNAGAASNEWSKTFGLSEWSSLDYSEDIAGNSNVYGGNIKYVTVEFKENSTYSKNPQRIRNLKVHGQLWGATYDIKINAEDNESGVKTVKYADGERNAEYFATNGTEVTGDKVTVNTNGTYTVYVEDKAGNKTVQTIIINQIDTSAPTNTAPTYTNTANSITVTNNQVDNESGIFKVEYAIKESGGEYGNWQSSNEFTGLRSSTTYNIKTRTINNANLKTESAEATVTTDTIQYTITLDNQGADTAGTGTIYEIFENRYSLTSGGQAMTSSTNQITKPEKTGSLFTGYYTGQNGAGTQVIDANGYISAGASNTLFTSDSTIYANWSTGSWLVTFDATGGTSSEPTRPVTYDAAIGTLPTANYVNHIFDGWYTAASGGTKITESTVVRGNVIYYAHWKDAIAEINGTYYISLAKAIEAVTTSDETTIRLVNDTGEKVTIPSGKNIIFDFGEHTLRNIDGNNNTDVILNNGNLTIISGNIISNSGQGVINNKPSGATLKITGGSVIASGNRQAVYNEGGRVEISGGYFRAKADLASGNNRATVHNKSGTMIITGGTIETTSGATNAIAVTNNGTMTIGIKDGQVNQTSPEITGAKYGINNEATIKLYDGNIRGGTGSGKGALYSYASNKISDKEAGYGIDHETVGSYDHVIYISAHTVTFNVNASDGQLDEELKKKTVQEGNQIGELPVPTRAGYTFLGWFDTSAATGGTQITAEDYIGNDDVTYYARWEKTPPAEINGQTYVTVQAAIDTCPAGGTVEIDVVADTTEEISIPSGKDVTINLNGYTVSNNGKKGIIKNKGSLTINGGDIDSTRAGFSAIDNDPGATLILDSVNIIAEGNPEENSTENRQTIFNKGGTVKITGNTYLESRASGSVSSVPRSTINNLNDGSNIGTVIIESGTIVNKNTELPNNKNACITNASGSILIIGNKEGLYNQESPTIIGKKYGIYNAGTVKFYDGTINGLLGAIAGTVTTFAEIEDYHNQDAGTKQFEIDEVTETYNSIYLIRPIAFTPSTEEMTPGPITVTITYNSQIVSGQKAGYGTTPKEAMANATEGTANSVTVTANGYVYAEGLTSGGEPVSATVEISNISN